MSCRDIYNTRTYGSYTRRFVRSGRPRTASRVDARIRTNRHRVASPIVVVVVVVVVADDVADVLVIVVIIPIARSNASAVSRAIACDSIASIIARSRTARACASTRAHAMESHAIARACASSAVVDGDDRVRVFFWEISTLISPSSSSSRASIERSRTRRFASVAHCRANCTSLIPRTSSSIVTRDRSTKTRAETG